MAVSKHSRGSLTSPGYEPQRFRAVWITPPLNALAAPGTNRRDYSDSLCCEEFKKARVLIMSPRHTGVLLQRITRQTGPRPSSRPVSTLDVGIRLDKTSIDSKRSNTILTFFFRSKQAEHFRSFPSTPPVGSPSQHDPRVERDSLSPEGQRCEYVFESLFQHPHAF